MRRFDLRTSRRAKNRENIKFDERDYVRRLRGKYISKTTDGTLPSPLFKNVDRSNINESKKALFWARHKRLFSKDLKIAKVISILYRIDMKKIITRGHINSIGMLRLKHLFRRGVIYNGGRYIPEEEYKSEWIPVDTSDAKPSRSEIDKSVKLLEKNFSS